MEKSIQTRFGDSIADGNHIIVQDVVMKIKGTELKLGDVSGVRRRVGYSATVRAIAALVLIRLEPEQWRAVLDNKEQHRIRIVLRGHSLGDYAESVFTLIEEEMEKFIL